MINEMSIGQAENGAEKQSFPSGQCKTTRVVSFQPVSYRYFFVAFRHGNFIREKINFIAMAV